MGELNLQPGDAIAGFRIERLVGKGAMATVYLATQLDLDRPVALKILSPDLWSEETDVERFFNEARAAAAFVHPNIVQAYAVGTTESGTPYFAMEYVAGETVADHIATEGAFSVDRALSISEAVAGALAYGWTHQELTHGDIKPENIILDQDGQAKLADFGLARIARSRFDDREVIVTPHYASPEAIRGTRRASDCRSDIYSLGATLYEMLCDTPPFPDDDADDVMRRHLEETPPAPRDVMPHVPIPVSQYVLRLMAKEPAERPGDWDEVRQKLGRLRTGRARMRLDGRGRRSRNSVKPYRRARAWCLWAVVAVLAIAAGAAWLWRDQLPRFLPALKPEVKSEKRAAEDHDASTSLRGASAPSHKERTSDAASRAHGTGVSDDTGKGELSERTADVLRQKQQTARHRLTGPRGRDRLSTLRDRLQEGETALDVVPAARIGAHIATDKNRTEHPELPEGQRTRAYYEFMARLARHSFDPTRPPESAVRYGRAWLDTHGEDSSDGRRVKFLVETVLPAYEEVLPALVLGKEKLVGEAPPNNGDAAITEVRQGGVTVSEPNPYGAAVRTVPWDSATGRAWLLPLLERVFGEEAMPDDRLPEPYLAFLLLHRHDERLRHEIEKRDGPEARRWLTSAEHIREGAKNLRALRLWGEARQAAVDGYYTGARQLLRQLQTGDSEVLQRYKSTIARLSAICERHDPGRVAGRLVQQAQRKLDSAPAAALHLCATVTMRYGLADFPEKDGLPALRAACLDRLFPAEKDTPGQPLPFQEPSLTRQPGAAVGFYRRVGGRVPYQDAMPTRLGDIYVWVQLETGAWNEAAEFLARRAAADPAGVPPRVSAAIWMSRGLLGNRYDVSRFDVPRVLSELRKDVDAAGEAGRNAAAIAAMTAEFVVMTSASRTSEIGDLWTELDASAVGRGRKRLAYAMLAWMLERGDAGSATEFARELLKPHLVAAMRLSAEDQDVFGMVPDAWSDPRVLARADWKALAGFAPYAYRLAVAAAGRHLVADDEKEAFEVPVLPTRYLDVGPYAAHAWFSGVLVRCAARLARGDAAGAQAIVDDALGVRHVAAGPYYTEFCLLKAGLLHLQGNPGAASEALALVPLAAISSAAERDLASAWYGEGGVKDAARPSALSRARNWMHWLQATSAANEEAQKREELAGLLLRERLAWHYRSLGSALTRYRRRVDQNRE